MIALGRVAGGDAAVAATLRALRHGGFYERRLALMATIGSRDGGHVVQAMTDASRLVRGLALGLVPSVCSDSEALEVLEAVPAKTRKVLLSRLVHARRRPVVDAYLGRLKEGEDQDLGMVLPFGSPAVVRSYLADVQTRFGSEDWQRLSRRHPDIALEALTERAEAMTEADVRLRHHVNAALPSLAEARPEATLRLVRILARHISIAQIGLQPIAERRPNEIVDLVLASEDRPTLYLSDLVRKLTMDRLLALARHGRDAVGNPEAWLRRMRPEDRVTVYEACSLGWRDHRGVLSPELLALMPEHVRVQEARRHLALPALATRPRERLPYATLLSWDEAQGLLEPAARNPDADLRGEALAALIGAARFHRDRLFDALAVVRARAKEQDPVRERMVVALSELPPSRWTADHLKDLGQIVRDGLDAADLSLSMASTLEELVVSLVPFHPEWSAEWLSVLAQERGQLRLYGLGDRLNDRDVRRIAPALLPVLQAWGARDREDFVIQVAYSLGRRLRVFTELVEILERLLRVTRRSHSASLMLSLIAQHRPDRLEALVPALIDADPSVITLPLVHNYLHRRRQDLLTPFLDVTVYRGRFTTGKTTFVLPFTGGFERWTTKQQQVFAGTLERVTRDTARDNPAIFRVVQQLAALPAIEPTRLVSLSDRRMEKIAVRDAALRALARLDSGAGVPVLVEALEDDRARVAVYALRAALREMPPDRSLSVLRGVPMDKVTVAKEVVRLLGELRTPEAYAELLALDRQSLHRDVRVALFRGLMEHLEEEATWPILERAAVDSDPAIATGVVRVPADRLSPLAEQRVVRLLASLLVHADPKVRLDTLQRLAELPVRDQENALLPRILASMSSAYPDESRAAARSLFTTYTRQESVVGEAVRSMLQDRRVLREAIDALLQSLQWGRGTLSPTARAVIKGLEGDSATAKMRVELALSGLPEDEIAEVLGRIAEAGEMHAEALMAGVRLLEDEYVRSDDAVERLEEILAAHSDSGLRRLALASLVGQATMGSGWTPARKGRLERYRDDPSPLVAAAAQFTFPYEDGEAVGEEEPRVPE
jgi:hypothetical protein